MLSLACSALGLSVLASTVTLIPQGALWKYLDDGSNQGTDWKEPGFDDQSWASGSAELGYGDGGEATLVSYGPDSNNKYVTTYFRTAFWVADATAVTALSLQVLRDDGAAVYLNGTLVATYAMPSSFDYRTYATTATEYTWDPTATIPVGLLRSGANVLAVEVHQGNATSTDLSLDLVLTAEVLPPGTAPDVPGLVGPETGATGVNVPPTLQTQVSDPDGDALTVTFYGRESVTVDPFTVVVLPDTQKYVASSTYAPIFTQQTEWIVNNQTALQIVAVSHEGDIVDTYSSTTQWDRANTSLSVLDAAGLPYGLSPGNHDQPTALYNQYFPPTRYAANPWYGGNYPAGQNDNNYILFSAGATDFILLQLEFWPTSDTIAWADAVLKAHANRKAIITTHGFLDVDGSRDVGTMGSTEYIWTSLVLPNPNVWFVLCGHMHGEARRTDFANGHPVHQLLADYQADPNGGNGWLRILRFIPDEDTVHVQTYSPYLGLYQTDLDSEFTLEFPMNGFKVLAVQSQIASGQTASHTWSEAKPATPYEWLVTATDPTGRTTSSPVWFFTATSHDTTPPVIRDVAVTEITDHSAVVTWTTDEPADSVVLYDVSPATSLTLLAEDPGQVTEHRVELTGLDAGAAYDFVVHSTDASGNAAASAQDSFTTHLPDYNAYVLQEPTITYGTVSGSCTALRPDAPGAQTLTELKVALQGLLDVQYLLQTTADPAQITSVTIRLAYTYSNYSDPLNVWLWTGSDWLSITTDLLPDGVCVVPNPAGIVDANGLIRIRFTDSVAARKEKLDVLALDLLYAEITVGPIANRLPVAVDDAATTTSDVPVLIVPLANDHDPDGDPLTIVGVTATAQGALLTPNPDQTILYTPPPGFSGVDTFEYAVGDGQGGEATATVTVAVNPPPSETTVHVASIDLRLIPTGKSWKATATTAVVDHLSHPVTGATVQGNWLFNGAVFQSGATAITDSAGIAACTSAPVKSSGGTFTFEVVNVTLDGAVYAPELDVERADSIDIP
ncbi:MAG TPA: Ig-like domain-containing protein [Verrucomicrobiota bacterium]|nr:Ig-like domain-containing protein [Verrucomicrobiota bacterium]HNU52737.1 Ig-like domain-containing protein [Verrucomicrobiota bacterium]